MKPITETLPSDMLTTEEIAYLRELTAAVINAAIVKAGDIIPSAGRNSTGIDFLCPGGRDCCYAAFWIRDFVMSLESGLVPKEIAQSSFELFARNQARTQLNFPAGGIVPPGSIPDHIGLDGTPIYFPGTFHASEQGAPRWGKRPPYDDHFYFIEAAYRIPEIDIAKYSNALELAFHVPPVDEDGIVTCTEADRGVSFGFSDSIEQTGKLLWATLLRVRAARHLTELFTRIGNTEKAMEYREIARYAGEKIPHVFEHESGMLRSSTGKSCQPDVWGSAFAVYEGILAEAAADQVAEALALALERGTISWRGHINHVPSDWRANEKTYWDSTLCPKNSYQNGAYWGTPVGWIAFAVARCSRSGAIKLLREYLAELQRDDFRKGKPFGAPWECMHPENSHRQNPVYMTSVTVPYAAVMRLLAKEK